MPFDSTLFTIETFHQKHITCTSHMMIPVVSQWVYIVLTVSMLNFMYIQTCSYFVSCGKEYESVISIKEANQKQPGRKECSQGRRKAMPKS